MDAHERASVSQSEAPRMCLVSVGLCTTNCLQGMQDASMRLGGLTSASNECWEESQALRVPSTSPAAHSTHGPRNSQWKMEVRERHEA